VDRHAVVVENLSEVETNPDHSDVYDREIGLKVLFDDPETGVKHYLIRYPPGLRTKAHRHTHAHTIVVLSGRMDVGDGRVIGPGSYAHFPAGVAMTHAPAGDEPCVFVIVFDGPVDAEVLDG
jgi:quercetin dioxygenase-like cupin family protein